MAIRASSRSAQPVRTVRTRVCTRVWAAAVWTVVRLGVGASLARPGASHTRGTAEAAEAPEVALAQAFTAAWNAGDAEGAAALFTASAQVRHRDARIVKHGGNVDVSDVYGVEFTYEGDPPRGDGDEVVWATGEAEIRAWLVGLLRSRKPVEAASHRVTGTTVAWSYRVPVPPLARLAIPGLQPISGTAEAAVSDNQ